MKKVIIRDKRDEIEFNSFDELLYNNNFVGFEPDDVYKRYMVITSGPALGLAVNPISTWADVEQQGNYKEHYYVFDTDKELYKWLLEGEDE